MRVLAIARQDLRLALRDRSSIFWIFIAPFLWVYLFGSVMRASDPNDTRVGLTVVVQDTSVLAERLVAQLRTQNFDLKVIEPGQALPTGKEAPARVLTIPRGFAEAILDRKKVALDLHEDENANPEGTFATQVALHRATVRLLADEALGGLDPERDAVRVRAAWAAVRRIPTGYYQSIPGNLVMFVLISTMTYGAALLARDRKSGILRRLGVSPLSRAELVAGKILGRAAMAAVQVGIFLLIGLAVFRIDWGRSPLGLAGLLLAYIACAAALGLLGGSLFASPDAASGIGIVLVLAMSAIGGCWWPAEVMPNWLRLAGFAFPTAWAMDGLHQLVSWGGGPRDVLLPCAVLSLYALAAGTVAARLLRRSIS